ncbi:MAG: hypothetical protein JHC87_01335 [Thermoleophilaceae bacterium]|nr:hypothetical protein [Thermoleophilaceae bacterium]
MIQRSNQHRLHGDFNEIAERWLTEAPTPEEQLIDDELVQHGREALSRLEQAQARCLLLRADGLGYPEICKLTGFSYPKVNRCLSEGRKAMRTYVGMIASGAECQRLEPFLSLYADAEADEKVAADLRIHLKHCLGCKATLRDYTAAPRTLRQAVPLGAVASSNWWNELLARPLGAMRSAVDVVQEKLFWHAASGQQGVELAFAKKAVIVSAVAVSLTAGGAGVKHVVAIEKNEARPAQRVNVQTPTTDAPALAHAQPGVPQDDPEAKSLPAKNDDVIDPEVGADPQTTPGEVVEGVEVDGNTATAEPAQPAPAPPAPAGNDGSGGGAGVFAP